MHLEHILRALDILVGWGNALQTGVRRVRFPIGSLKFFIDLILPAALWSWGRLSLLTEISTRNIFWSKGCRYPGMTTLPPSYADSLEILGASASWGPKVLSRPVPLPSSGFATYSYRTHVLLTHSSVYSRRFWFDGIFLQRAMFYTLWITKHCWQKYKTHLW